MRREQTWLWTGVPHDDSIKSQLRMTAMIAEWNQAWIFFWTYPK